MVGSSSRPNPRPNPPDNSKKPRGLSDEFLRSLGLCDTDTPPTPVPPPPTSVDSTYASHLLEGSVIGVEDIRTGTGWLLGRYTSIEILPGGRHRIWLSVPVDAPPQSAILVAYDSTPTGTEWRAPFGRRVRLWVLFRAPAPERPREGQIQAQP